MHGHSRRPRRAMCRVCPRRPMAAHRTLANRGQTPHSIRLMPAALGEAQPIRFPRAGRPLLAATCPVAVARRRVRRSSHLARNLATSQVISPGTARPIHMRRCRRLARKTAAVAGAGRRPRSAPPTRPGPRLAAPPCPRRGHPPLTSATTGRGRAQTMPRPGRHRDASARRYRTPSCQSLWASWASGVSCSRTNVPLLPPLLRSRRTPSIDIARSTALHMS